MSGRKQQPAVRQAVVKRERGHHIDERYSKREFNKQNRNCIQYGDLKSQGSRGKRNCSWVAE